MASRWIHNPNFAHTDGGRGGIADGGRCKNERVREICGKDRQKQTKHSRGARLDCFHSRKATHGVTWRVAGFPTLLALRARG